ncbi:hypothetical protein F5051DRAFT_408886 [Lentinula edodes]|nr:hypothetical protein F5051DRAFT_408886 [Lentinula edodes]
MTGDHLSEERAGVAVRLCLCLFMSMWRSCGCHACGQVEGEILDQQSIRFLHRLDLNADRREHFTRSNESIHMYYIDLA